MELHLDRRLSERRIFAAIDIYKSGTRKDELILSKEEAEAAWAIRRSLNNNPQEVTETVINNIIRTKTNMEFIKNLRLKNSQNKR